MASYEVIFKPSVQKDLRLLPQSVVARIFRVVEELKNEPIPRRSIKVAGAGQLYRVQVGSYSVIYGVDKESKQVIIHYVRHRREVYRQL